MMNVVLIGDDDLPWKKFIAAFLDTHPIIRRIDWHSSRQITSSLQRLAHCFVYVARTPDEALIRQLGDSSLLVLVAEADHRSSLFIKLDDFATSFAQDCLTFIENFRGLVSSYEMEGETLPSLTSVDDIAWETNHQFNGSTEQISIASKNTSQPRSVLKANKRKMPLSSSQLKVASAFYHGTRQGLSKQQQHMILGYSDQYYYGVLAKIRDIFLLQTYPQLYDHLCILVAKGQLNLDIYKDLSDRMDQRLSVDLRKALG